MIRELAARKLGIARSAEDHESHRFYHHRIGYWRLLYRHIPEPWPGAITLIANEEELRLDHDFGWTGFAAGGLDVHAIAGSHDTMLTEHGREVAQIIRRRIDEAMAEPVEQSARSEAGVS